MSTQKLNNQFLEYIKNNITPGYKEWGIVADKYDELVGLLEDKNVFQSGSCARFTSVKPINDLDVVWVISEKVEKAISSEELDLKDVLSDLANKLQTEYKKIGVEANVKPQTHSVGIYFGESERDFSIDVVPARKNGINEFKDDMYIVPEILFFSKKKRAGIYKKNIEINWIKSDPKGYKKMIKKGHDKNDNLRKVIRFIKKWRWYCKNNYPDFPLKSFHLELVIADLFLKNPNANCLEGIKLFFDKLPGYLAKPCLPDRADNTCKVDAYIADINKFDMNEIHELVALAKKRLAKIEITERQNDIFDVISLLLSAADDNEQFVHSGKYNHKFVDTGLELKINGKISLGKRTKKDTISHIYLRDNGNRVVIGEEIEFYISEEVGDNYQGHSVEYLWKVKNRGEKIFNKDGVREHRGEITQDHTLRHPEQTAYNGVHFVECYAICNGDCIAYDRIYVHIDK